MTRSSRFLYFASLTVLGGIAWFENRTIARHREELESQSVAALQLERRINASHHQPPLGREFATDGAGVSSEPAMDDNASDPGDPVAVSQWLKNVKQLRQAFIGHPAQRIPQLALLNDHEWVALAREAKFETADDIDGALASARTAAKSRFVGYLYSAMESYLGANQGRLPSDLSQLLPFLAAQEHAQNYDGGAPASDPAMLAQYELKASDRLRNAPEGPIVEEIALIDEELDHRIELAYSDGELVLSEISTSIETSSGDDDGSFERSVRAFVAANGGAAPNTPADLIPFLDGPLAASIKESITQQPATPEEVRHFKRGVEKLLGEPSGP
jgi:hypothetical protein